VRCCISCGKTATPVKFDEILWNLPDGAFARRVDVTLERNDSRRFLIPAGVRAIAFVNGKARSITSASVDYWTILRASDAASSVDGAKLHERVQQRAKVEEVRLTVVIARPGPCDVRIELDGIPTSDGIPMDVELAAAAGIQSLERLLGHFLSGEAAFTSQDEIERRIAMDMDLAIKSAVGSRTLADILRPEAKAAVLADLSDTLTSRLAKVGLETHDCRLVRLESETARELLRERGAATAAKIGNETLRIKIDAEIEQQNLLTDIAERLESIEERRAFVIRTAAARETDTRIDATNQQERFSRRVREIEHALHLERLLKDGEIEALQDKNVQEATVRAIAHRLGLREQELADLKHRIELDQQTFDQTQRMEIGRARTKAEIREIEARGDQSDAEWALKVQAERTAIKIKEEQAAHDRAVEMKKLDNQHQLEMGKLLGTLPENIVAMMKNISPELATALTNKSRIAASDVPEAQAKLLGELVARQERQHQETLEKLIRLVEAARSGGTTVHPETRHPDGRNDSRRR
jgi:hypothetical protein